MAATVTTLEKYWRSNIEYGTVKVSIPTADVKTLFDTKITAVAAPGAGKYIEMLSGFAGAETYGGTPYDTNVNLCVITDTAATSQQFTCTGCLNFSVARFMKFIDFNANGATETQIIANKALQIWTPVGNPATGNSTVIVVIKYRILTL